MAKRKPKPKPLPEFDFIPLAFPPGGIMLGLMVGQARYSFGSGESNCNLADMIEIRVSAVDIEIKEPFLAGLRRYFMQLNQQQKDNIRMELIQEIFKHAAHRFTGDVALSGQASVTAPKALAEFAVIASGEVIRLLEAEEAAAEAATTALSEGETGNG